MFNFKIDGISFEAKNATDAGKFAVEQLRDAPNLTKIVITLPNNKTHSVTKVDGAQHWDFPGYVFSGS